MLLRRHADLKPFVCYEFLHVDRVKLQQLVGVIRADGLSERYLLVVEGPSLRVEERDTRGVLEVFGVFPLSSDGICPVGAEMRQVLGALCEAVDRIAPAFEHGRNAFDFLLLGVLADLKGIFVDRLLEVDVGTL